MRPGSVQSEQSTSPAVPKGSWPTPPTISSQQFGETFPKMTTSAGFQGPYTSSSPSRLMTNSPGSLYSTASNDRTCNSTRRVSRTPLAITIPPFAMQMNPFIQPSPGLEAGVATSLQSDQSGSSRPESSASPAHGQHPRQLLLNN